jgi:hypothetical protein
MIFFANILRGENFMVYTVIYSLYEIYKSQVFTQTAVQLFSIHPTTCSSDTKVHSIAEQ